MRPEELIKKAIVGPKLNKSGIYMIYCINSRKGYIGRASSFRGRFKYHKYFLKNEKHVNQHLQRAYRAYGENAFIYYVLEFCEQERLCEREAYYVSLLDKTLIYNICGIQDAFITDWETRERISNSLKGIKRSEEFKEKMKKVSIEREAKRKELGLKKKPISDTHRENLRLAKLGQTHSEETKKLIGEKSKGRKDSEETRLKKSEAQIKRQLLIKQNRSKLES